MQSCQWLICVSVRFAIRKQEEGQVPAVWTLAAFSKAILWGTEVLEISCRGFLFIFMFIFRVLMHSNRSIAVPGILKGGCVLGF